MKNFTLLTFFLFTSSLAIAQVGWQPGFLSSLDNHNWANREKASFKYTGTPYLEDDFVYGSISDENGNSRDAFLRYNAIEEIVEIKLPDTDKPGIKVLPKVKNLTYSLNDYKYIFDSFITSEGERIEGYIIEYYNGRSFGLYGNPLPKLTEARRARTAYERTESPHLSVEVDYYIKNEEGILHRVNLRDKDFKNVLPKSAELNKYLADNKLKTPQDYAGLLKWLDENQN